jgi:hypothetical protein
MKSLTSDHGNGQQTFAEPKPSTKRMRELRRRERAGLARSQVEYSGDVLTMLIRLRWLDESEADDARKVGSAISRLLADTAKR